MYHITDYEGQRHLLRQCPKCGRIPEINNCGPEAQGLSCHRCNLHVMVYQEIGSNNMILEALRRWNWREFDEDEADASYMGGF